MDFVPETFKDAILEHPEIQACSPGFPSPEFRGLTIAVPERIVLTENEVPIVPVCVRYYVAVAGADEDEPCRFYIYPSGTKTILSGELQETGDDEPEEPPPYEVPEPSPEDLEGVYVGGYFSFDAQRFLEAPLEPGHYKIVVTYAGAQSDAASFDIAGP